MNSENPFNTELNLRALLSYTAFYRNLSRNGRGPLRSILVQ